MDPIIPRKRGRPRKRPLVEDEEKLVTDAKKNAVARMRSVALVGQYVLKNFEGNGTFLGKVICYDTGLYRIDYEDGDCEDLESRELRRIIIDESAFTSELNKRRNRLDKRIRSKSVKSMDESEKKEVDTIEVASSVTELTDALVIENNRNGDEVDASDIEADSSSDSCEYAQDRDGALDVPPLPLPPELPTSSGNLGVPEEYVSHLFSVYGVLRSFSIPLFLCPFGLDDFVGALNCTSPNTLLDAIHVALMRALKLHLENLSSEDSELASKCLRSMDWDLLDTMTWPIYVIHYLTSMGHLKGQEWRGFHDVVLVREYYTLLTGQKLLVLQILCDDILDYSGVRAEIDTRVASEVGAELDGDNIDSSESGPRRVHPRFSKTSACQNKDSVGVTAESDEIKSQYRLNSKVNRVNEEGFDATNGDGNYDECRLCGMDGYLLCCDGCPSAFHPRCIGVTKMHIPEGPWFCPECTVSKNGPPIALGTSLAGAVMFGIDLYEQAFLGTYNHLLVMKVSFSESKCLKYYNLRDIVKVLQVLNSSAQYMALYVDICKRIVQYWNIPEDIFSFSEMIETRITQFTETENVKDELLDSSVHERQKVLEAVDCAGGSMVDSMAVSTTQACGNVTCVDTLCTQENGESGALKHLEQIRLDSASSACSVDQQVDPPDLTQQHLFDKSSTATHAICTFRSNTSVSGHLGGMRVPTRFSYNKEQNNAGVGGSERDKTDDSVYFGFHFKSHVYMNQYWHGYFAASAAASLATRSAEEGQADGHGTGHPKKPVSAIFQQIKAFSSTATRFFWPSPEKKLWEVPRERCGWCYSCKAPPSSRRGCMLNAAASGAIKGTVKILSGLRTPKIGEGSIPIVATYILLIEESFCGLIGGPFLFENYRKSWRELVEQTTSSVGIKALLLELEEHIRLICLSSDWVKLVDDHLIDPSTAQAATLAGSTQRRGPGGRRNKKQSAASQITDGDCLDKVFCWWRRGKLSKLLLDKAILPRSVTKRAARQGGLRKISVVNYASGSEIPRRSKQLLWRAAVERSKNASQLALQVRCLDSYLRWNDVVRPEPNVQDGKTAESDASIFRNAGICDKRLNENTISYGVDFGVQKHLPSRIMKCAVGVEKNGGNDRYWFSEAHVPLYLIKEYEESANKASFPSAKLPVDLPSKMRESQLKAARLDFFSYLIYRRDNKNTISCAFCHQIVPLRKVVKCSACQGYCHESCTMDSKSLVNEEVKISITCRRCFNAKAFSVCESTESPTSPLLLQTQEQPSSGTVSRVKVKGYTQPLASGKKVESSKDIKQIRSGSTATTKTRTRIPTWGIIWRKKSTDDTGSDFRQNNILLKGCDDLRWPGPVCHLCQKPYNSNLMYIRCPTCSYWYHADALELNELKFFDVVGFKCCKCRRIKSPECPYDDRTKKRAGKKEQSSVLKQEPASSDSDYGKFSEWVDLEPSTPIFPSEEKQTPIDDPLLHSSLRVEQITDANVKAEFGWNTASGPALQKLPVRRHIKRECMDGSSGNAIYFSEATATQEFNIQGRETEKASCASAGWDISSSALEGEVSLDGFTFEDMEFEPQTYFTFGELLADQSDDIDASQVASVTWENESSAAAWDGVPDDRTLVFSDNGVEPMISIDPTVDTRCNMCSDSEHVPDLFCLNCGLWIHRHCSPWVETDSGEGGWKCGNCREWQ